MAAFAIRRPQTARDASRVFPWPQLLALSASPLSPLRSNLQTCQRVLSYPLSFHTLPNSFALSKISTLLFSSNSKLFYKNTGGWGYLLPLYEDQNETANC